MTDETKPTVPDLVEASAEPNYSPPTDPLTGDEAAFAPALDTKRLRQQLNHRQANRALLLNWIRENLREGVDYGKIHVVGKDKCSMGNRCTDPYHFSKPSLWKPGAEKICGMLGWTPTFPNLSDYLTRVRVQQPIEQILLRCVIYDQNGRMMGEGAGARHVDEDARTYGTGNNRRKVIDLNKSLKMCEKSAMADALLRAAGLSEIFTQDMDPTDVDDPVDPYTPGATRGDNALGRTTDIDIATHCPIGKDSRGKRWDQVEDGMLHWIVENIDDKPELVARVREEQKRRKKAAATKDMESRDTDPTRKPPVDPNEADRSTMGDLYRAIVAAETVASLDETWQSAPEKFQPAMRKEYEKRRVALFQSEVKDEVPK